MNYDSLFESRKQAILQTKDQCTVKGTTYFVSNAGDDANDGTSPDRAWASLKKVSEAYLYPGDGVRFRRGDIFRGKVTAKAGIFYGAYGEGDKPKLYGGEMPLADPSLWVEADAEHHIWRCTEKLLDAGTLVFNEGQAHARKLIPGYRDGQFVCRDDESRPFVMSEQMTQDLDLYWHYDTYLTRTPSKNKDFPIPFMWEKSVGDLYLRCDQGNPGEVFESIESVARVHMFNVGNKSNVTIDNLCIKYVGMHGVSGGGHVSGLTVTNCEMGWIGGTIQHYAGTDPNYPEGDRGSVTRFGNAVEIYGGCDRYRVSHNYIYQVYDAAITHQITTSKKVTMTDILYRDNLIEDCVYGIEYFLNQVNGESESIMDGVVMENNFIRRGGCGWGQQRHNTNTPALIKGWSFTNPARNYAVRNNIFDRCAYRLLHLVARDASSCPIMSGNTYIQYKGGMLGQYGGNADAEPPIHNADSNAVQTIEQIFGDKTATVILI